jgi:hypothetical protein
MGGTVGGAGSTTNQQQQIAGTQSGAQTSATSPYAPAAGLLSSILGGVGGINPSLNPTQSNAIGQLSSLGAAGDPYQSQIGNVANTLLSGGGANSFAPLYKQAYQTYANQIMPTASGQNVDPNTNPFFANTTNTIQSDVQRQIEGLYAGSGLNPAGASSFAQQLGRGVAQGEAPTFANVYQQNVANQLGAAGNLFGAGTGTAGALAGLNQTSLGNMQAGIGAAGAADQSAQYGPLLQLQAQSMATGIPLQTLAAQMGIALPAGQAFGTTAGTSSGTNAGTVQGQQQTQTTNPLWQAIAGGLIGGTGLLSSAGAFKPGGFLNFSS